MSFDSTAGAFVLGGDALDFSTNSAGALPTLTQNSASAETINNALSLANNLTVGGTGTGTLTLGGALSGAGGLTMAGGGTTVLVAANTYTGDTNVNAGRLTVGNGGSLGNTTINVNAGANLTVTGTGAFTGTNNYLFLNGTAANPATVTLSGTAPLSRVGVYVGFDPNGVNGVGNFTQNSGSLSVAPNGGLEVAVTVNSVGTYTLNGGTLSTAFTPIGFQGKGTFIQNGGTFSTNGDELDLGYLAGSSGSYTLNAGSLQTGPATVGYGANGTFTQNGGTFSTGGSGLVVGKNNGVNATYTLNGGSLTTAYTELCEYGCTGVFTQSGASVHTTGVLNVANGDYSTATYNLNGGTLAVVSVTRPTTGTGIFNFNGGILQARADNTTFFGGLSTANVQGGGAVIDTQGYSVTIAQDLLHDTTAGASATDGGLTKLGAGTLTLTGANSFSGPLNVEAGILAVASESNLGAQTNLLTVSGGGELLFTGSTTLNRAYNLGVSKLGVASGSTLTFAGATVSGGYLAASGTDVLGTGTIFDSVTTLAGSTLNQTAGTAALNTSTIRGTFTQTAGATLNVADTTLTGAGTLNVFGTVNTSGVELDGVTTINSGATLANSGSNLVLGSASRTTVNAGGMLTTVTGVTIELNGALLTNNGTQTGTLNVNYGSTLKGAGSFGTVNVTSGGRFSPGNSPGTATVNSLGFQAAGSYQFELTSATAANNNPGNSADLLNVSGRLTISAGTTANSHFTVAIVSLDGDDQPAALADFDPGKGYRFVLATTGGIDGFNAAAFTVDTTGFANSLSGGNFSVVQDGNNLDLVFNPVPEPSTWGLLSVGLLGVVILHRRARRA